jgi:hypothetical protein
VQVVSVSPEDKYVSVCHILKCSLVTSTVAVLTLQLMKQANMRITLEAFDFVCEPSITLIFRAASLMNGTRRVLYSIWNRSHTHKICRERLNIAWLSVHFLYRFTSEYSCVEIYDTYFSKSVCQFALTHEAAILKR